MVLQELEIVPVILMQGFIPGLAEDLNLPEVTTTVEAGVPLLVTKDLPEAAAIEHIALLHPEEVHQAPLDLPLQEALAVPAEVLELPEAQVEDPPEAAVVEVNNKWIK
ncbi:hypothetical protein GFO_2737 [Christiangramia forsetii KT0803]|uniref:Uncharacterized protein n=1 Tax=Christiangramia forsetii (strain DSM 17595 / CGMCC 1.15422 / KT0803) TaxID=411154 RepID=A0M4Z6_CHRFK|nr:hypothetical protein GFO_2737 [Christiangramia forsetii KT0803]